MLYDYTAFCEYMEKTESDPRLSELVERYENDASSLTDEEVSEMVKLSMDIADGDEYPEDDYYEDWDNLEMGFDPYMGCYSDDC